LLNLLFLARSLVVLRIEVYLFHRNLRVSHSPYKIPFAITLENLFSIASNSDKSILKVLLLRFVAAKDDEILRTFSKGTVAVPSLCDNWNLLLPLQLV
jgi:hypothetical protein